MRQLLIREHTLRMHHVEDDDRVAAQLDEYHVRELVNDQFARCEFQTKLDTDSSRIWTLIPRETGH